MITITLMVVNLFLRTERFCFRILSSYLAWKQRGSVCGKSSIRWIVTIRIPSDWNHRTQRHVGEIQRLVDLQGKCDATCVTWKSSIMLIYMAWRRSRYCCCFLCRNATWKIHVVCILEYVHKTTHLQSALYGKSKKRKKRESNWSTLITKK